MEFRGYYGKHKRKSSPVRQVSAGQKRKDNRLSCRLSDDTWNEIDEFMQYNGLDNLSGTIECLLSDSLLDWKIAKQNYELSDI